MQETITYLSFTMLYQSSYFRFRWITSSEDYYTQIKLGPLRFFRVSGKHTCLSSIVALRYVFIRNNKDYEKIRIKQNVRQSTYMVQSSFYVGYFFDKFKSSFWQRKIPVINNLTSFCIKFKKEKNGSNFQGSELIFFIPS